MTTLLLMLLLLMVVVMVVVAVVVKMVAVCCWHHWQWPASFVRPEEVQHFPIDAHKKTMKIADRSGEQNSACEYMCYM